MLYTIPDYYKEFQCTADKCEDTCCAGWQIMVDDRSLAKYKKMCGEAIMPSTKKIGVCDLSFALRMLGPWIGKRAPFDSRMINVVHF